MKILITGASGFIGSSLVSALQAEGHELASLVRRASRGSTGEIAWDPDKASDIVSGLQGFDAVIHLAGENIGNARWTPEKKRRILESRKRGTALLARSLAACEYPPGVLISASATGYYGDRGEEVLSEGSMGGTGFLAEVCRAWENATNAASDRGIRVVNLRFGIVLSAHEGALPRMLLPFRLGFGGKVGSGRQYMSWICLEDLLEIIKFILQTTLKGPVNVVAPEPVRNREFVRTLGRVLCRPALFPTPGFILRILFGEMADALLLCSARVRPARLITAGYRFKYPDLEGALRYVLREYPRRPRP
jgi:uncharacterized protein